MRFSRTERVLHWVHAVGFFAMLATGLALYLPALAEAIGRRELIKNAHLVSAIAWLAAILLVVLLGDRRRLGHTIKQFEMLDGDDRRWLRRRPATQGRFNAGQKLHAVFQGAFAALFVLSGVLLWLGERNTTFRLSGTVVLHDGLMFLAVLMVIGHLYLAIVHPPTRPALRGIVFGDVRADWAADHHARWAAHPDLGDGPASRATEASPSNSCCARAVATSGQPRRREDAQSAAAMLTDGSEARENVERPEAGTTRAPR